MIGIKKPQTIIICLSLVIIFITPIISYQVTNGLALDNGFSFVIDNQDKIYYDVGSNLDHIYMKGDRLQFDHSSGDWGLQYQGGNTNLTTFPETATSFIMTLENNATVYTLSNNTVYWDFLAFNPKYVKIYDVGVTQIDESNFKLNYLAYQATPPPAVYVDYTTNKLEIKSNNTIQDNIVEISFQENIIVPDVLTVLTNNQSSNNTVYLGIILSCLISVLLLVYFIRRKTYKT